MLTANVGHGQDVAECGKASASTARARVPGAPPAKIAAISRRSARGSMSRGRRDADGAERDACTAVRSAAGSGTVTHASSLVRGLLALSLIHISEPTRLGMIS